MIKNSKNVSVDLQLKNTSCQPQLWGSNLWESVFILSPIPRDSELVGAGWGLGLCMFKSFQWESGDTVKLRLRITGIEQGVRTRGLEQQFLALAAHWNHLGDLRTVWCLHAVPRGFLVIGQRLRWLRGSFIYFYFLFKNFKDFIQLFLERGEGKEKGGGKHQCVVGSPAPPTGDLACNLGMYPDWELNWRPFKLVARLALNPLSHTNQGSEGVLKALKNSDVQLKLRNTGLRYLHSSGQLRYLEFSTVLRGFFLICNGQIQISGRFSNTKTNSVSFQIQIL